MEVETKSAKNRPVQPPKASLKSSIEESLSRPLPASIARPHSHNVCADVANSIEDLLNSGNALNTSLFHHFS